MPRNLRNRIEQCTPILERNIKNIIINDLESYLKDNSNAWIMQADGQYAQAIQLSDEEGPFNAQHQLLEHFSDVS